MVRDDEGFDGTLPVSDDEAAAAGARAQAVAAGTADLPMIQRDAYAVAGELARGGLGRILRARDRRLDRPVALKETLHGGPDLAARFVREALVTARLQHPAIVPVYEAGRWPTGEPFYAMKLVTGRPLDAVIGESATIDARLALLPNVIAVCDALAYAHQQRIIHRDLKPQNVLVGSFGETVVIDWGLAKDLADGTAEAAGPFRTAAAPGETAVGAVMGTPAFMPPEQARGEPADERADVYALGAILYHVLAGDPPYTGKSSQEIIDAVVREPPVALDARQPGVPADLAAIVAKAMARAPADRYPTAAEMATELRRFQTGQLVGAHQYSTWQLLRRWLRRHRTAVMVAAAALAILAVISTIAVWRVLRERDRAEAGEAEATRKGDEARERLSRQYEEQGRQELLAGQPDRALVYLAEAYQLGDRPSLRTLLAQGLPFLEVGPPVDAGAGIPMALVSFMPDGERILAVGIIDQGYVMLQLDAGTGRELSRHPLPIPIGKFRAAALGPDGSRLLVVEDKDQDVREELADGGTMFSTVSHSGLVLVDVAIGQRVASALVDDHVWVATWADGGRRLVLEGSKIHVVDGATLVQQREIAASLAAVSEDGKQLATRTAGRIALHDLATLRPVRVLADPSPADLATGANRTRMWFTDDVLIADAAGFRTFYTFSGQTSWSQPHPVSQFVRTGDTFATADEGQLTLWSLLGDPERVIDAHPGDVRALAADPTGTLVVTTSDDSAALWSVETGALVARLADPGGTHVGIAARGERLLFWGGTGIRVWRLPRPHRYLEVGSDDISAYVGPISYAPDGRRIAVDMPGETGIFDTTSGKRLATIRGHERPVRGVAFSPDGRQVLTASNGTVNPTLSGDGTARIWDASSGAPMRTIPGVGGDVTRVSWGAHGPSVLASSKTGLEILWVDSGKQVRLPGKRWSVADDGARALLWTETGIDVVDTRDGRHLAALGHADARGGLLTRDGAWAVLVLEKQTVVVDAGTGQVRSRLDGTADGQLAWTVSPDGSRLAVSDGNRVQIWDLGAGALRTTLEGHTQSVATADWSPDGSRIATGSSDNTARIWDPANGALLATLGKHGHWVMEVTWSPDGTQLAAEVARANMVRLWDVRLEARTPAEVTARVRCRVPLKLVEGVPLPAETDPAACR